MSQVEVRTRGQKLKIGRLKIAESTCRIRNQVQKQCDAKSGEGFQNPRSGDLKSLKRQNAVNQRRAFVVPETMDELHRHMETKLRLKSFT